MNIIVFQPSPLFFQTLLSQWFICPLSPYLCHGIILFYFFLLFLLNMIDDPFSDFSHINLIVS